MEKPADYIDVSKIEPPPKHTLRADIKVVISQFGKQKFFAKHVYWVLLTHDRHKHKDLHTLYSSIRKEIHTLAAEGVLNIISRGKPGTPNVYRVIQIEAPSQNTGAQHGNAEK